MFWGLIVKANKKYSQTVEKAFHLSVAALDTSQVEKNAEVQLLLNCDNSSFLLCTLSKAHPQAHLDLNFIEQEKVCFSIKGEGAVHLNGFLIPDDSEEFAAPQSKGEGLKKAAAAGNDDDDDDEDDSDDESFDLENAAPEESEDGEEEEEDSDIDTDDDAEEDDSEEEQEVAPEPAKKKAKVEQQPAKAAQNGVENGKGKENAKKEKSKEQGAKSLPGGVQITDLTVGGGPEVRPGKKVTVFYEGRLKSNNKLFDSTKHGPGFKFAVGKGTVIKGWDIGVVGMKLGGKRRIVCPPNMAYGAKGSPPVIPPNATLVFDVEVRKIQ